LPTPARKIRDQRLIKNSREKFVISAKLIPTAPLSGPSTPARDHHAGSPKDQNGTYAGRDVLVVPNLYPNVDVTGI